MAVSMRFAICVTLISLTLCYAPDGWKLFTANESDKSKFRVLHDWPTDEGSYLSDYTESIAALEISDVMLQTMGIFRHTLDWQGVHVKNLFKRPQATALFILDGLSDDTITESFKSYSVDQRGLYGELRSDLMSMFEGDHVLRHFNRLFNGKGISLLLSGDKEAAIQLNAVNTGVNPKTLFDKMELRLVEFPVPIGFDSNHATIDIDSNSVTFNLDDEVDLLLFTELAMMMNAVETLPADKISDGVPDVFVLAVSSLQSIRAKYGSDSIQMKAASQLVSACVTKMNRKLVDIYNGDIITQLLSLVWERGSDVEDGTVNDPTSICDDIIDTFNARYVACQGATCKSINCDDIMYQRRVRRDIDADQNNTNNTSGVTCSEVCPEESYSRTENFSAMFAVIAFVTIVLLAAVFAITWAMWTMDPGKDSIVYQMTAPRVKTE